MNRQCIGWLNFAKLLIWTIGQLETSKDTSITDKPIGRLGKRRWVGPWYLSYAILGCTMGGMFPILIPLLALKRFSSACHVGLIMAAFNLGGLMAPIWGSVADRYGIHRVLLCSSLIIVAISLAALSFTNIFCAVLATACVTGSALGGGLAAQWGYTATVGMAVVTEASGLILIQKISANRFRRISILLPKSAKRRIIINRRFPSGY